MDLTQSAAILNAEAGHDYLGLKAELDQIQKAQSEDPGPPEGGDLEAYHSTVQTRCRRAIEIIAIIRRANTGPAKAGKRGSTTKAHDMAKVRSSLLE